MLKRLIALLLLMVFCFVFAGCGEDSISMVKDKTTGEDVLVYQDNRYYLSDEFDGDSIDKSSRKLIDGGEYDFGFYYSYTDDKPMYLVSVTNDEICYIREDYSFSTDTFNIIGSDVVFVYNESVYESNTITVDTSDIENVGKEILLYSKACPYLIVKSYIFRQNSLWYIYINGSGDKAQEITPEFSDVLFQKGLLY